MHVSCSGVEYGVTNDADGEVAVSFLRAMQRAFFACVYLSYDYSIIFSFSGKVRETLFLSMI